MVPYWGGIRWKRLGWNDEFRGPILVTGRFGTFVIFPREPVRSSPDSGEADRG